MSETRGGGGGGRLDATGDREVVYCHQCHAEWYNDEHGLECPTCEGQITEIVCQTCLLINLIYANIL
jgi:E3 ubiquitin-protein ligase RNF115/126